MMQVEKGEVKFFPCLRHVPLNKTNAKKALTGFE